MDISIIIPMYNEEKRISGSLNEIYSYFDRKKSSYEVIVVDDGSKDRTIDAVKRVKNKNTKIISYPKNRGKGYAVKTGMLASKGKLMLFTDSDLSTPIQELDKLEMYLDDYEVIIGSRAMSTSLIKKKQSWYRVMLGRFGNWMIRLLAVPGIKDTQCGFKLFKRNCMKIFEMQTIERWGFDFELLFLARKYKLSIKEVPVTWVNDERSKVKLSDYPKTMLDLLRIRYNDAIGKYKIKNSISGGRA